MWCIVDRIRAIATAAPPDRFGEFGDERARDVWRDGRRIVFERNSFHSGTLRFEIYANGMVGPPLPFVTESPFILSPVFSPDGSQVVLLSDRSGTLKDGAGCRFHLAHALTIISRRLPSAVPQVLDEPSKHNS
jgi:hypothetical protein